LEIRFWGVRGSIASPISNQELRDKIRSALCEAVSRHITDESQIDSLLAEMPDSVTNTYGGNTSCVTIHEGDDFIVLDAGSGLRLFGKQLIQDPHASEKVIHILLSHFHQDHIIGFPFFAPAFREGTRIVIHTPLEKGRRHFETQQGSPFSPVHFDLLSAEVSFESSNNLDNEPVGGFLVSSTRLHHPGGSMAYRVSRGSSSVLYMTDVELAMADVESKTRYRDFAKGSNVAIIDSMYGMQEAYEKTHWGHSAPFPFIDLFRDVGLDVLVLFHHDPDSDDAAIDELLSAARRYNETRPDGKKMSIVAAREGLTLTVPSAK